MIRWPLLFLLAGGVSAVPALGASPSAPLRAGQDWPQFMRDAEHTGSAPDESLQLPLGLVAQVRLDDAVLSSPAVVGGRAYVVDQMGTAYGVDPKAGRIVWKSAPDGDKALGSNTSSPCVVNGRVYYGTLAGNLHILDARDGTPIKTVRAGWPVPGSPTFANGAIYFQALDAVVRCLDLDGNEKWRWDHYKQHRDPGPDKFGGGHPGSYFKPHYGGGEVAVSGTRVVTHFGWDLVCLEDKGTEAALVWCVRCPAGKDGPIPMSSSISEGTVTTAGMGADGVLGLMRFALKDGSLIKEPVPGVPFPWVTPAVRGQKVVTRSMDESRDTIFVFDGATRKSLGAWRDTKAATPVISSPTLAKDHVVATTLTGELLVFGIGPAAGVEPLRLRTPHGKGIGSSPVISGGRVHFGGDDGYFYVYGSGGATPPRKDDTLEVCRPKAKVVPATGKVYGWTSVRGNSANSSFVDDPDFKPPLALRWAARSFGHFKTPCVATAEGDVVSITLQRTVTCQEQATGRMRWRTRLLPEGGERNSSAGMLVADGRLYVPCPARGRPGEMAGRLLCLDLKDGSPVWTAEIGSKFIWTRTCPVAAGGNVIFSHVKQEKPPVTVVEAWDAVTGKSAWQVELNVTLQSGLSAGSCTDGNVVYTTAGVEAWGWKPDGDRKRGEVAAVDARSGRVLWRKSDLFGSAYPVLIGDKLLLHERAVGLRCVSANDGAVLWKGGGGYNSLHSVGSDYIVARGYGGDGIKYRLEDGKSDPAGGQFGGDTHACSSVALTPRYSIATTVGGLNVRDAKTGTLLWDSPGFAPRACVGAALANGRVFWPGAANGMIYCWEPAPERGR